MTTTALNPASGKQETIVGYSDDGLTAKFASGDTVGITDLFITEEPDEEPETQAEPVTPASTDATPTESPAPEAQPSPETQPQPSPLQRVETELQNDISAFIARHEGAPEPPAPEGGA